MRMAKQTCKTGKEDLMLKISLNCFSLNFYKAILVVIFAGQPVMIRLRPKTNLVFDLRGERKVTNSSGLLLSYLIINVHSCHYFKHYFLYSALEDFEKCSLRAYDQANCVTDKAAIRENLKAARLFLSVIANITCNEFRGQCAYYNSAAAGHASYAMVVFFTIAFVRVFNYWRM